MYSNPTDVLVQNWGPIVSVLKDKGVEWITDVTTLSEMEHLLQAMSDAGWKPTVVDLGQQYYDESLPGKPGTDGALVLTNTAAVRGGRPQPGPAGVPAVAEEGFAEHAADDARRAGVLRGPAVRAGGERVGFAT